MSFHAKTLASIFILTTAAAHSQSNDPIGFFPADGNVDDISANHHSDYYGSYAQDTGKAGQGFGFDGLDYYLDLGTWFMQQSFTISFWMKDNATLAVPQKDDAVVISQHNSQTGTNFWDLRYAGAAGHYQVETNNGGAAIPISMTQGAWHCVLLSRNNLSLQVFVDGVLQGSSSGTTADSFGPISDPGLNNEGIRMGKDRNGLHQWMGGLDELRFYDRPLGSYEIAALSKYGVDTSIQGTANPYLADQPTGSTLDGDTVPANAPVATAVVAGHDIVISAAGAISTSGGIAVGLPTGGSNISHASAGGIASYAGPGGALVGIFLGATAPTGMVPAGLNYTAGGQASRTAAYNSPLIGQVFYIGDRQGTSGVGHFIAPPTATRLFLGVIDGGNSNNTGSFRAHIVDATLEGPYERVIAGTSNIYGAGASAAVIDGTTPPSVTFPAAAGQVLRFTGVNGSTRIDSGTDNGGNGANGPDGGTYQAPVNIAPAGGLSGFKASRTGALVGVFLVGGSPGVAPATLDFTTSNSTNFTSLSPLIGQVFFVGDGLTADGKPQDFNVPATARRLYLGIADGSSSGGAPGGYANNDGQFDASFQLSTPPRAVLKISAKVVTTADPVSGLTAQIGDFITYTFHWQNTGNAKAQHLQVSATIPTYREEATGMYKQFTPTYNQFGHPVAATSPTANDAKIVWDVADLDPSFSQEVTLKIQLNNNLKNIQTIVLPNNYNVASTTQQPAAASTGFSSGAANVSVAVSSALRFTATPDTTTVAPGKYVNYTLKLSNLSHVDAPSAAAVFTVPEFTRFVRLTAATPSNTATSTPTGRLVVHSGSPNEVLVNFGKIPALGSSQVTVTVQAQWVDPAEVTGQLLSLFDYGAAFLSGTSATTFEAALTNSTNPTNARYFNFIQTRNRATGTTFGDSGTVMTQFQGSTADAPDLKLTKALSSGVSDTLNDGMGNVVDVVNAGEVVTYTFAIANLGKSPAEDVYIQDAMPSKTTYVSNSAQIINATSSALASHLEEPTFGKGTIEGQHIVFRGLHLSAKNYLLLSYQVRVAGGTAAPAPGTILTTDSASDPATGFLAVSSAGTSSSPHTVIGLTNNGPLEVTLKKPFAQPNITPMLPNPEVSTNITTTRAALDAVYAANQDEKPLTNSQDQLSFIPGMERFYVHYENLSGSPISNVDLVIPLPAHTAFYRASYVTLTPNPASGGAGIWPGVIDNGPPPKALPLDMPAVLSTGKSVTAHFDTLDPLQKGDVMVEVIVTPDAINIDGSFTGSATSAKVVIKNPNYSVDAPFPRVKVAHRASTSATLAHATSPSLPIVPEVGILKIAPTVVNVSNAVEYTFIIFNSGATRTPACTFQFIQPKNTEFIKETHTSSYNGKFVIDAVNAIPGSDLECFWDYIPAHSAVAVTYTMAASGPANVVIEDLQDRLLMNYAGELDVTPSQVGVVAAGTPVSGDPLTFSVTGHTLYQFPVGGASVGIIDLGDGRIVVNEPTALYHSLGAGGVNQIAYGRKRGVFVGPSASVGVSTTSASFMLANHIYGSKLAPYGVSLCTTVVPAGCTGTVENSQVGVATGTGPLSLPANAQLETTNGASNISQGNALISQDGAGLISQDGAGLATYNGGIVISNDGGSLISKTGAGVTAMANTTAFFDAGGGNRVLAGAGNLVSAGAGN